MVLMGDRCRFAYIERCEDLSDEVCDVAINRAVSPRRF